jgi:secreted trypsin-like serine protease
MVLLLPATAGAQSGGDVGPRIVGGSSASISQYPWQVAVVFSPSKVSGNAHQRQFCGGSLITSRIVMTAGHCVADTDPDCSSCSSMAPVCNSGSDPPPGGDGTCKLDADDVDVVLGQTTLSTAPASSESSVVQVKLGTNYNPGIDSNPSYDAAYLVLPAASAQPQIKIAGTDEGALWDPGSVVEISGWGTTSEGGSTGSDTLRAATVNVLPDTNCSNVLAYGLLYDTATQLCAGNSNGGVDTCQGDSGGPLQAPLEGGGYRLVGLTSWGQGCAEAGFPGVYARIAGAAMRSVIQSDVSSLPSGNEALFGSGGQPRSTNGASTQPTTNPFAKCKKIKNRKKRRRCIKKVRARLEAGA